MSSPAASPARPDVGVPGVGREDHRQADDLDLPALWAILPGPGSIDDLALWAASASAEMARDREIVDDPDTTERIRVILEQVAVLPGHSPDSVRLLFMPHPDLGAVLWEVVVAHAQGPWPQRARALVSADAQADLGADEVEFEENSFAGLQCVRFFLEPRPSAVADAPPPKVIVASAAVALRRYIPDYPELDVVALAATSDLDALIMSLEPLRVLLASDYFPAMLAED